MIPAEVIKLIISKRNEIRKSIVFSGMLPRFIHFGQDYMVRPRSRDRFWGVPHWLIYSLVLSKVWVHLAFIPSHAGQTLSTDTKKLLNPVQNHAFKQHAVPDQSPINKKLECSNSFPRAFKGWLGIQGKFGSLYHSTLSNHVMEYKLQDNHRLLPMSLWNLSGPWMILCFTSRSLSCFFSDSGERITFLSFSKNTKY